MNQPLEHHNEQQAGFSGDSIALLVGKQEQSQRWQQVALIVATAAKRIWKRFPDEADPSSRPRGSILAAATRI
jgi:hypothetical protein